MTDLFSLLGISSAYAADAANVVAGPTTTATTAAAGQSGGFMQLLPMLIIFILFMYFVMIRPQQKRAKDHNRLLANLKKGDEIVTIAGILGKIEKITDEFIVLNIAENVNISIRKNAVATVLPKGTIKSNE